LNLIAEARFDSALFCQPGGLYIILHPSFLLFSLKSRCASGLIRLMRQGAEFSCPIDLPATISPTTSDHIPKREGCLRFSPCWRSSAGFPGVSPAEQRYEIFFFPPPLRGLRPCVRNEPSLFFAASESTPRFFVRYGAVAVYFIPNSEQIDRTSLSRNAFFAEIDW